MSTGDFDHHMRPWCVCPSCRAERLDASIRAEAATQQPAAEWYGEPVYPTAGQAKAHINRLVGSELRRDTSGAVDAAPVPGHPPLRLDEDSDVRKRTPIASGVLDYFPDAIAAVAAVSHAGNEKHNPGEPLHWTRGKSNDHADCLQRHFVDRGGRDSAGVRHSAAMAWRALALLQEEIEDERGLPPSRGSR